MAAKSINVKKCKVVSVTSPTRIASIAKERGINPQEVFVRLTFSKGGKKEYTASNKLRIIGKTDYEMLRNKIGTEETVDLVLSQSESNLDSAFFYVDNGVTVEDLFKEKVEVKDNRLSIASLFKL